MPVHVGADEIVSIVFMRVKLQISDRNVRAQPCVYGLECDL